MGKIPTNSLGKSSELKLHCFCLYNAYSMPKDIYSVCGPPSSSATFDNFDSPVLNYNPKQYLILSEHFILCKYSMNCCMYRLLKVTKYILSRYIVHTPDNVKVLENKQSSLVHKYLVLSMHD